MNTPIPNQIAHYRIVKKLGQGGMSIVYEGMDERLKRPIAIKILHPFLAGSKDYRSRFFREAQAVARLMHPNIVQIFDVANPDQNEEQLYIVTELLVGETLKDFSERINLIEMPELAAVITQKICHALEHAHSKGIIHRDIKPENIMIGKDGHIKLMDFGIASIGNEESITQAGVLLGSLAHVSPEVIKGARATVLSDVFSLATVLYFLLTKQLPFSAQSPHALLKAIVDNEPKPVRELSPYVSDDIAEIVEIGMKKNPSARFASSIVMAEAIGKSFEKMGVIIDDKLLELTLKDPEKQASHFKAVIEKQLKKKLAVMQEEKNDHLVLALLCRLEAAPVSSTNKTITPKTKRKRNVVVVTLSLSTILFFLAGVFLLSPKSVDEKKSLHPSVLDDTILTKKSNESGFSSLLAREDEIEKKEIEVVPPLAPVEKIKQEKQYLVDITVWPFANINVDGKIVAKDKKSLRLKLAQGSHRLIFTHTYAATVEKNIEVKDSDIPLEVNVSLNKSKPAFLIVKSVHGGDIAIDGNYKGTAEKSQKHPIVIFLPDKSYAQTKEIIVSQKNFAPYIVEMEFIAGQTKEIEVKLIPL